MEKHYLFEDLTVVAAGNLSEYVPLEVGETYFLEYDGAVYESVCIEHTNRGGSKYKLLGNPKLHSNSYEDNGIPFMVRCSESSEPKTSDVVLLEKNEAHSISVYQYVEPEEPEQPETNPHIVESKGDGYALYNGVKVLASEVPEGADSIPLDGMNVIEWDGDTTGLEGLGGSTTFYYVSNATDVDVNKTYVIVRKFESDGHLATGTGAFSVNNECYSMGQFGRYVSVASEAFPTVGVCFRKPTQTTVLFAYYPIEEEPENSTGKDFLLHQMFGKVFANAMTGKFFWFSCGGNTEDTTINVLVSSDGHILVDVDGAKLIPKE